MIDKAKSSQSLRKVRRTMKPQNQESQRAQSPWRVLSVKSRIPRPKNPLVSKRRSKETTPLWKMSTFLLLLPFSLLLGTCPLPQGQQVFPTQFSNSYTTLPEAHP